MRPHPIPLRSLAVENLTVGRMEPVRFIEEAGSAGFGAVGLALATATPVPLQHEIIGRPEVVRAIKAALAAAGLRVFDIEAFVLAPGAEIETYRRVLETGAELGASHVSAIGAPVGETGLGPQQRIDLLGALCDEAARFGLHVGVECMLYRDIRTVAEALALIEAAGRGNAGIILDVLHLHRAGTDAAALAALPPGRVAYAQLCDVARGPTPDLAALPTEARSGRLQPGTGVAALAAFLDALPDGTTLAIETPVGAEAALPTAARLLAAADHAGRFLAGWAMTADAA